MRKFYRSNFNYCVALFLDGYCSSVVALPITTTITCRRHLACFLLRHSLHAMFRPPSMQPPLLLLTTEQLRSSPQTKDVGLVVKNREKQTPPLGIQQSLRRRSLSTSSLIVPSSSSLLRSANTPSLPTDRRAHLVTMTTHTSFPVLRASVDDKLKYNGRRCHSMIAPTTQWCFGDKVMIKSMNGDKGGEIPIVDPFGTCISWAEPPETVLLLKKDDEDLTSCYVDMLSFLTGKNLTVYIEHRDAVDASIDIQNHAWRNVKTVTRNQVVSKHCEDNIDLVICIGGDGTLIRASSFFPKVCPPVMSFNCGSVGFLNPFNADDFRCAIEKVLTGNVPILVRERLYCQVRNTTKSDAISQNSLAMNEIVIDRGPHPYLTNIDMHLNDRFVTKVQGDGMIISTPTGSTAYAMAAGASMVHPNVNAIVICPICPHSLSFRPIVVPHNVKLKLTIPDLSRNSAWLSIDGRYSHEVRSIHSIEITSSAYPVPCICARDQIRDWFDSLSQCLHWNVRVAQKPLRPQHKDTRQQKTPSKILTDLSRNDNRQVDENKEEEEEED